MKSFLPLLLLATLPAAAVAREDAPRTYLASIVDLPLGRDGSLESFSFDTWGVEFVTVCKIPNGWRIKVGSSLTPNGTLAGEGSQGVTWFRDRDPIELRELVLVRLTGAVQEADIKNGQPATFEGEATISTDDGDAIVPLSNANVWLTTASKCP